MKLIYAAVAFLVFALGHAEEVKFVVSVNGQTIGTASCQLTLGSEGRLTQISTMTIDFQGMKGNFRSEILEDKMGRPNRYSEDESHGDKKTKTTLAYGPKAVTIDHTEGGKSTRAVSSIPKGNLADPADFWFVTTRPKPGASTAYLHYDYRTSKWESRTSRYIGDEVVPGTKRKGHHISGEHDDNWIDDKGMSIRLELIESGAKLVLTRTPSSH